MAKQAVRKLLFQSHDPYQDLTVLPFNTHGWNSNSPAFEQAISRVSGKCDLIIEVGTWMGGSARTMAALLRAKGIQDFEIVCVDTYLGSVEHWTRQAYLMTFNNGHPTIYHHFLSNAVHTGTTDVLTPFPCDSINAYETLKIFNVVPDLIYIDAGHDYESVKADIHRWKDILRPGGVLLLDDAHHPPIQKAVEEELQGQAERVAEKFLWTKPVQQ